MSTRRSESPRLPSYVLITAAHNEQTLIGKTLKSVAAQTWLPKKWVIVSDGSTDRTDEIVREYALLHPFIHLLRLEKSHKHNFAAQVHAIKAGYERLQSLDYEFIGNVDADVSFEPSYFGNLLQKFETDPQLGLAGGFIYEDVKGEFKRRGANTSRSVAHAVQMFRRRCYDEIGGYTALPYGGPDWCAEVAARMRGWRVESFPDLPVFHHRSGGGSIGAIRYWSQQGWMDYSLGSDPLFEVVKCARRVVFKPYIVGALVRLGSFFWAQLRNEKRPVSDEFMRFLREEQMERLRFWRGKNTKGSRIWDY